MRKLLPEIRKNENPYTDKAVFDTKFLEIMRFLLGFIILLEILKMIPSVENFKYLSQNLVNFSIQGLFWNPQDVQISKLSLDLKFEQDL